MIDFHTHSFFSDGVLVPSELVRRAYVKGYKAIGVTDHVDSSNLEQVAESIITAAKELNDSQSAYVIPGVEITHAPPSRIRNLVTRAREIGVPLVIVHGESPVEPVAEGTNLAAIEAGADILAHPGFINENEARLALKMGVYLEITSRGGHNRTNGHVAVVAELTGARLVVNTDAHAPGDLMDQPTAMRILMGAGLNLSQAQEAYKNNEFLLSQIKTRMKKSEQV